MNLIDRVQMSLARRAGQVVLRVDLVDMAGRSQLSQVLRDLQDSGKLLKLGSGVYAKARKDGSGVVQLCGDPEVVAAEVFDRIGVKARLVRVETSDHESLYVMDVQDHRVARNLQLGPGKRLVIERDGLSTSSLVNVPTNLNDLPTVGVREFIESLAKKHAVEYRRSKFDDWTEAVTRAAGDDVRLDETEKLLVALKRKHLITGRQAGQLLTNYMEEEDRVEAVQSVRGSRDRGLSSQL